MEEDILIGAKKNNKNELTLDDLVNSGRYSTDLIDYLRRGDYDKIFFYIDESARKDRAYMEPLLHAVKNDLGTYAIFKYCPENIQRDETIAKAVIAREPELLYDTPLSRDVDFIFKNAKYSPQIINYVDRSILEDDYIVCSLCYLSNSVASEVLKNTEIDVAKAMSTEYRNARSLRDTEQKTLANDRSFISEAIQERGVEFLHNASEEVKNDHDFLKEQTIKDTNMIDFAIENAGELGTEGLKGIREASTELTIDELWKAIESDDPKFILFAERLKSRVMDDRTKAKILSAYLVNRDNNATPEQLKNVAEMTIKNSLLDMESIKKDIDENGEIKYKSSNITGMIAPAIFTNLILKLETQGISLDEDLLQKLNEYFDFYNDYHQKYHEIKRQKEEENLRMILDGKSPEEIVDQNQDIKALASSAGMLLRVSEPSPELIIGILKCSFVEMDRIKNDIGDNKELLFERARRDNLISNILAEKFVGILEKQGVVLDADFQKKVNEYLDFYKDFNEIIKSRAEQNITWKNKEKEESIKKNQIDSMTLITRYDNMLNSALKSMETVKSTMDEHGNYKIGISVMESLPLPVHLDYVRRQLEAQSIIVSSDMQNKYNQYLDFYHEYKKAFDQVQRKQINIDRIEELISEQRISDIKVGEQRLVENLRETEKEKAESQYINSRPAGIETDPNMQEELEDSSKDDTR